jgi:hypothetical protein
MLSGEVGRLRAGQPLVATAPRRIGPLAFLVSQTWSIEHDGILHDQSVSARGAGGGLTLFSQGAQQLGPLSKSDIRRGSTIHRSRASI